MLLAFLIQYTPPKALSNSKKKKKMRTILTCSSNYSSTLSLFSLQFAFPSQRPYLGFSISTGLKLCGLRGDLRSPLRGAIRAVDDGGRNVGLPRWEEEKEEESYEILPNGKRGYLDEQDVVTFLDPPTELIPLDPSSYNPAAYLWKKIGDIPEERRHRLLDVLNPRLISRAWEIAGTRYEDPNLTKKCASKLLSDANGEIPLEFWNCRTSGGPVPISWFNVFKKAIFCGNDGIIYGRFIGGSILAKFINSSCPLYFMVKQHKEVLSTEQPCDLAYEFGDGLLGLQDYPEGFPRSVKHPYPFNDQVVIYIRYVGPGVFVGQAWQEGTALQQIPQKLCGEILMVKQYAA